MLENKHKKMKALHCQTQKEQNNLQERLAQEEVLACFSFFFLSFLETVKSKTANQYLFLTVGRVTSSSNGK